MPDRQPIAFIATAKPEAAKTFYSDIVGLKLRDASPFALVFEDSGIMLRVQIVTDHTPPPYTVHGWSVARIEDNVHRLKSRGATFLDYDQLPQDDLGIWTTPEGAKIAWFKDPDGNILSLTEFPKA